MVGAMILVVDLGLVYFLVWMFYCCECLTSCFVFDLFAVDLVVVGSPLRALAMLSCFAPTSSSLWWFMIGGIPFVGLLVAGLFWVADCVVFTGCV